jgi:hypothetical protein
MSRSTCVSIVAPFLLCLAVPAMAAPPQSEQFIDFGFGVLPPIDCGNFILNYEMSGERARVTTFFDNEGNPTRMRLRWVIHGTLTHSATGQILRDQSSLNVTSDLNSGSTTVTGIAFHYVIPGTGLIFLDAGRVVVAPDGSIAFQAGPKDALPGFGQLCEALAI